MSLSLLLGPQLRAYAEAGYDVIGCSAPGPYVSDLESFGIRHVALQHATRAVDPASDARLLAELVSVFRQLRPEIVHTHNPKPGILGRVAARTCGVPVVVNTVHGLYAQASDAWARRAAVYAAERIASACSQAELVQNPEDVATLLSLGVPPAKVHLLGNGVDLDRFCPERHGPAVREQVRRELGLAPSEIVVGVVGRLVWEKGYRELFEAARRWTRSEPRLRLVVVGPAEPDKADAVDQASLDAARSSGALLLGERSDVERLYSAFDIYVLASHREGFPRSAMEAAAMALPVIATDIRGCRQVVENDVTGVLVPVGDPSALESAVVRLATNDDERAAMGKRSRDKAHREFDQRDVISLTLDVYDRLSGRSELATSAAPGVTLRYARPGDAVAMARLHRSELPDSFLSSLGERFLTRLYRRIIASPGSFAIVASTTERGLSGFVAGTEDTGALYRQFAIRDGAIAGLSALPHLSRSPGRVLETFRYGSAPARDLSELPSAELLSLAVDPAVRRRGVGRALLAAFAEELSNRRVAGSRIVVGAGNDAALGLYESFGFRRTQSFELHRGARSEVLVGP